MSDARFTLVVDSISDSEMAEIRERARCDAESVAWEMALEAQNLPPEAVDALAEKAVLMEIAAR